MAHLALTSCSNPTLPWAKEKLPALTAALERTGHTLDTSGVERLAASASAPWRWDPRARAKLVMDAFRNPDVDALLDISGGDLASEVTVHLETGEIAANPKLMVGYSDMSCILGALPCPSLLWNPLVGVTQGFEQLDMALRGELVRPPLEPVTSADPEEATAIANVLWTGGNIRCFLKLAGTPWWPDLDGCVLLMEGQGPSLTSVAALLGQHQALGTFEVVRGIVVGQFTEIDRAGQRDELLALVCEYARGPVWQAPSIGHSATSGAVTLN